MNRKRVSVDLNDQQGKAYEILTQNNTVKYLLFGGAAGGGKSILSCFWLISLCTFYHQSRWFIGREELKRIRESWLPTFYKFLNIYKIPTSHWHYNGQDHYLQHYKGARIDLLDLKYLPSDPMFERYGSIEYTGGAIEEGGETHFGAFDVLKSRIGRYNNDKYGIPSKILITSNPKKNWLKTLFINPYKSGHLKPEYSFIPAFAYQNQFLDKGYIDNLNSITDPVTRARLRDGDWDYADDKNQLISFDKINDLFTNEHVKPGEKFITADIARFGKDKTVIGYWEGFRLEQIIVIDKSSIPEAARQIRALANIKGVPVSRIIVDEEGVGGGAKDILNCKGFISNARAVEVKGKPQNYSNLKAQVSFMFSEEAIRAGVYIKADTEKQKEIIIEEIEQIRSDSVDNDSKLAIISKDKVKESIGRSPDFSDMIVMRWWFELPVSTVINNWSFNH